MRAFADPAAALPIVRSLDIFQTDLFSEPGPSSHLSGNPMLFYGLLSLDAHLGHCHHSRPNGHETQTQIPAANRASEGQSSTP